MPVQHIPYPNTGGPSKLNGSDPGVHKRVETGAVQFGDDWPGLFIRGDNAFYYAMNIRTLAAWYEKLQREHPELTSGPVLEVLSLKGLADVIEGDVIVKPKGKPEEKRYGVYLWDTFDNQTIRLRDLDTLEEAEKFVIDRFGDRISSDGADVVKILDRVTDNTVRSYTIR